MNLTIAAIRSGTDPVGKLPDAAFHRTLETQIGCPKCDASYNLVVDWEQASSRWFEEESRSLMRMLKKAIHMGHASGHRVSHFETSGVVVKSFVVPENS
ncbi:MAG: hypothetical protein P4K80_09970 [Acidobacteriaceae bacterium]|nr:hypothetical protein [Acidobacteriaceae bacterium]